MVKSAIVPAAVTATATAAAVAAVMKWAWCKMMSLKVN